MGASVGLGTLLQERSRSGCCCRRRNYANIRDAIRFTGSRGVPRIWPERHSFQARAPLLTAAFMSGGILGSEILLSLLGLSSCWAFS